MTPIEKYVSLKKEIARLEDELDELKESIFSKVEESGGKVENEAFVLSSQKRPRYKFSDDYEKKNDELKALKKQEIESGAATISGYSEFVTVKFREPDAKKESSE